jgi:hypothetical protein
VDGKRVTAWQGLKLSGKDVKDVNVSSLSKGHARDDKEQVDKRVGENTGNLDMVDGEVQNQQTEILKEEYQPLPQEGNLSQTLDIVSRISDKVIDVNDPLPVAPGVTNNTGADLEEGPGGDWEEAV